MRAVRCYNTCCPRTHQPDREQSLNVTRTQKVHRPRRHRMPPPSNYSYEQVKIMNAQLWKSPHPDSTRISPFLPSPSFHGISSSSPSRPFEAALRYQDSYPPLPPLSLPPSSKARKFALTSSLSSPLYTTRHTAIKRTFPSETPAFPLCTRIQIRSSRAFEALDTFFCERHFSSCCWSTWSERELEL